jgi:hypothetical protein
MTDDLQQVWDRFMRRELVRSPEGTIEITTEGAGQSVGEVLVVDGVPYVLDAPWTQGPDGIWRAMGTPLVPAKQAL